MAHQVLTGVKLQSTTDELDARPEDRRPVPGDRPRSQHGDFPGPARHDARRLSAQPHRAWPGKGSRPRRACSTACPITAPRRTSRGSSPAATSSTPTIARPSPRPDRVARPPWIARNGWKPSDSGSSAPLTSRMPIGFDLNDSLERAYHALRQSSPRSGMSGVPVRRHPLNFWQPRYNSCCGGRPVASAVPRRVLGPRA